MARIAIYLVGLVLVLAALWLLVTETGLAAVVPFSLLAIGLLLILGLGIIGAARTVPAERYVEHEVVDRPVTEYRRTWWRR